MYVYTTIYTIHLNATYNIKYLHKCSRSQKSLQDHSTYYHGDCIANEDYLEWGWDMKQVLMMPPTEFKIDRKDGEGKSSIRQRSHNHPNL